MACGCPPGKKTVKLGGAKKGKGKGRPANPFILFFMDTWKKEGGNMFCMAQECGRRWRKMSEAEKDKWRRLYCAKCKACNSCKPGGKNNKGAGGSDGCK